MRKSKVIVLEIAKILKTTRIATGMTQEELGKKMGLSQSALSKMEAGKLEPSAIQWMKFSKITRTKPDILMKLLGEREID